MSKLDATVYRPPNGLPGKHMNIPRWHRTVESSATPAAAISKPESHPLIQDTRTTPARRAILKSPGALGIRLDTSVSTHSGQVPEQLFPKPGVQSGQESFNTRTDSLKRRKKGAIPPPLDLSNDLSPFDRIIHFCLSPSTAGSKQHGGISRKKSRLTLREVLKADPVPRIVVTPAQEQRAFEAPAKGDELKHRMPVPSSIYSISPMSTVDIPPVPQLPKDGQSTKLLGDSHRHQTPKSGSSIGALKRELEQWMSPRDKRTASPESSSDDGCRSVETVLPTPRRSKGWWNLLISPLSASQAPKDWSSHESEDSLEVPILSSAADMSGATDEDDSHSLKETDRLSELRPHSWSCVDKMGLVGAATSYYDLSEDFTALQMGPADLKTAEEPSDSQLCGIRSSSLPRSRNASLARENYKPSETINRGRDGKTSNPSSVNKTLPKLPTQTDSGAFNSRPVINRSETSSPILGIASAGVVKTARSVDSRTTEETAFGLGPLWREDASSRTKNSLSENERGLATKRSVTFGTEAEVIKDKQTAKPRIKQLSAKGKQEPKSILSKSLDVEEQKSTAPPAPATNAFTSPKNRKWLWVTIVASMLFVVVLTVILTLTITQKYNDIPAQAQWLNLTGFPPLPTGIATIIRPNMAWQRSGCVNPSAMWSCAVPKEVQASMLPNAPDQPNFQLEIRFDNGTVTNTSSLQPVVSKRSFTSTPSTALAAKLAKSHLLTVRDALTSFLYTPSPPPPSSADQGFLGNTTDDISPPYAGESTPFFISLLTPPSSNSNDTTSYNKQKLKRSIGQRSIPTPSGLTSSPTATLYPLPAAQPLKLYNRGLNTEHYGFYTYFTRSIFLNAAPVTPNNTNTSSSSLSGPASLNANGGAPMADANVICLWPQTRFRVQIWTRAGFVGAVPAAPSSSSATATSSATPATPTSTGPSSAFDITPPGSFPYYTTITLDRHGGDPALKGVVCYGFDSEGDVVQDESRVIVEDRAFGGTLVDAALGPFEGSVGVAGGVDGGTGGCGCEWRNWG